MLGHLPLCCQASCLVLRDQEASRQSEDLCAKCCGLALYCTSAAAIGAVAHLSLPPLSQPLGSPLRPSGPHTLEGREPPCKGALQGRHSAPASSSPLCLALAPPQRTALQVPLETLRGELQQHVTALQSRLVEVINEDYNDFVSLSTRLTNVDGAVLRMQRPLLELQVRVLAPPCAVCASSSVLAPYAVYLYWLCTAW